MCQDWEGHPKEGWEGHPKEQPSTSLERPSTSLERPSTSVERPSTSVERPSTSLERGGHLVGKVSCVVCVYRVVCVVPRCIHVWCVLCRGVYMCGVCVYRGVYMCGVCVPRCIHVWYTCVMGVCCYVPGPGGASRGGRPAWRGAAIH